MNKKNAVEIHHLDKHFEVKRTGHHTRSETARKDVLKDINLDISKGECIGIIGRNGSGKSTLLKLISKILYPDGGTVEVSGNVASILELGMGFHPDMSGRENIFIKSSMFGFSKKDTERMLQGIIDFSELGDQIDDPIRTYSSGMTARLAFSVIINVKCDVLIVDEVLSVGDIGFQDKCSVVFEKLKNEGKTIILASNVMSTIETLCDRVAWIDGGTVREIGPAESVCYHYSRDLTDSPDIVRSMAEAGDVVSQNRMGVMLRDGSSMDRDLESAESWFRKASNLGSIDAMVNLADMLSESGRGEEAREYYEAAAAKGNQYASMRIHQSSSLESDALLDRIGQLADAGSIRAAALMADIYTKGTVLPKNPTVATDWLRIAAEADDASAQLALGLAYRDGAGVPKDAELAEMWLSRAAASGSSKARTELTNMFRKGMGVPRDMGKVIGYLKESANSGDANAMFQLGILYHDGNGIEADASESERWHSTFAQMSLAGVEYALGDILNKSNVKECYREEAVKWFQSAAEHGNVQAMQQLGIAYRDGSGVAPDSAKAFEWFSMAAEHGNVQAMAELGSMYLHGNGVQRDPAAAFNYYRKAALAGNAAARYQLGMMYHNGIGTDADWSLAKRFLLMAAESGNRDAILAIVRLSSDMNPAPSS